MGVRFLLVHFKMMITKWVNMTKNKMIISHVGLTV